MEIRSIGGVQAQGRKVTGYAALFNSEADLGEFRERIAPGGLLVFSAISDGTQS